MALSKVPVVAGTKTLTRGSIVSGNASGEPAALAIGSNGQVLKSDGTDAVWGTDAGGAALTGSTNNTVTTVTGANAIQGEANLTFDGGTLTVKDDGSGATTETLVLTNGTSANPSYSNLVFKTAGNTSGCWIKGVQDSGGNDGRLEFHVNNSGTVTEAMRIRYDGTVGIGTSPDNTKLKIQTTTAGEKVMQLRHGDAGTSQDGMQVQYYGGAPNGSGNAFFSAEDTSALRFKVASDGDVTNVNNSYGGTSDERIKQNITDASSQWDDIKALKIRNYKLKSDTTKTNIGVVAQELETAGMNGLVTESDPSRGDILVDSSFGTLVNDTDNPNADGSFPKKVGEIKAQVKGVKYSVLYMKAIKALQESMERIEQLEAKVTALENA